MFQFKYRKYRTSSFHFVCCWWIQGINKYIFKTEPLVCLIHFRREKEHEGLFPKIGTPAVKQTRKPVTDQFPTVVYTDPQCLQIIKQCDKDANASYVKEFHSEINEKLSQE